MVLRVLGHGAHVAHDDAGKAKHFLVSRHRELELHPIKEPDQGVRVLTPGRLSP